MQLTHTDLFMHCLASQLEETIASPDMARQLVQTSRVCAVGA